ncbi:hypothetical protein BCR34DRAFT_602923 [Clohesyomyces aquaticus]|uniref:Uncharacterized protein n=1 Tax=Clohesyomyces aquaticus TaxID=1231657 RepID=A0A1Y1ZGA7_9PLEO|nr:hypothetical protein BCR34DRAFT_602923 [Clohesyomyces aquaticus]
MVSSSFSRVFVSFLSVVSVLGQTLNAPPYNPSPFEIIGDINGMTLNPTVNTAGTPPVARGGQLMVNGQAIVIPDNTLVTLPASIAAWSEFFTNPAAPPPALPLPGNITYTAVVQGNRVGDLYIAGTVYFQQVPLQSLGGFVTKIDLTTGHFWIGGKFSSATPATAGFGGMECVLNDPTGVYGRPYTANPLWGVDPENPCIRATTGYPMCIPRTVADDPRCPKKNRPIINGKAATQINFRDPNRVGGLLSNEPDSRAMAPIMVGDSVTVTGQQNGLLFEVTGLIANAGFYTAPNSKPAYLAVEGVNVGVGSTSANVEVGETRAVAFTTDPTTPVEFFFVDVNRCSGAETERSVVVTAPQRAGQIGRVIIRMGKTLIAPPTRNVRFRYTNGVATNLPLLPGMTPGEYTQPIYDFIMPELTTFGANEVPFEFERMRFLADGEGPFELGNPLSAPITPAVRRGQLDPWPGLTKPALVPATCPPLARRAAPKVSKRRAAIEAQLKANGAVSKREAEPTPEALEARQTAANTITITSAVTKTRGNHFDTTVDANINNVNAVLWLTVGSTKETVGAFTMGLLSKTATKAFFESTVQTKGKPTFATVFATVNNVRVGTTVTVPVVA